MPSTQLEITALIDRRCRELGLTRVELIKNCCYRNVAKGLRRLEQLRSGDLSTTIGLIERLPQALHVPDSAVTQAIDLTRGQLHDAHDTAWRAAFKPYAVILTDRSVPQPIFVAAVIGVDRLLRIDFEPELRPVGYAHAALKSVRNRLLEFRSDQLPAFGRPIGVVINFGPDYSVRFDLSGKVMETVTRAHRPGKAVFENEKGRSTGGK
jgi:hypothetical protein